MLGNKRRGWIGVDLGERAIKIAQLRRTGDRLRLESATAYRRSAIESGALLHDLRSAKALSQPLAGVSVAATLSMHASQVEPADDDTTAPAGHCSEAWQAGPESSYALSVPTVQIESTVDLLAGLGLHCDVIDGPPLAIARGLQLSPGYRPDALLGALDWGESCVTLVAARNGQAVYVRRLATDGFEEVRRYVAGSLGLSESDAERVLAKHGAGATPEARAVAEALSGCVRPLVEELRRTLEHLGGKLKSKGPEKLYVLGAGGAVPGLPGLLSSAMERPFEAWTAAGIDRGPDAATTPDCLLVQAIALSALAWEAHV